MKLLIIESLILCLLFTIGIYIFSREPIKTLYNYPPKIIERVKSLEIYKDKIPTQKEKISVKLLAVFIIIIIFSLILRYINKYTTFIDGFIYSFVLWTIVNIYDALVMDIIWFCHDPHFVFKGTEDMVNEYHDYLFHIKQSLIGEGIAVIVCLLVGLVVSILP